MSERSAIRILLLQIREHEQTRTEEYQSFCKLSQLAPAQVSVLNVFDTPTFSSANLNSFDALFVGGASEASVLEPQRFPFIAAAQQLLLHCIDQSIPVFASCFGFQLAVTALNSPIYLDTSNFEMGTLPISLRKEAAADLLFAGLPSTFLAVSVHRMYARKAPPSCVELAYTERCCQAFRVSGKPFWAFQFHPEVDRQTLVERLTHFKDEYTDGDEHLQTVLESAQETPSANLLPKLFVDRVLCAQNS